MIKTAMSITTNKDLETMSAAAKLEVRYFADIKKPEEAFTVLEKTWTKDMCKLAANNIAPKIAILA